ncbi:MAG: NAD(+) synthase [Clostridia bacterium]|nr:NAD(+) synthase [Clostridia bacterium]
MKGIIRISAVVPEISVGNVDKNLAEIMGKIKEAKENGARIVLFPELSLCGYTCADLFFQKSLLLSSYKAIKRVESLTLEQDITVVLGAPLMYKGRLYNCAFVIGKGKVLGIVPKSTLKNYDGFSEKRVFSSGSGLSELISSKELMLKEEYEIPFGEDLIFSSGGARFGIEIGEDLMSPIQKSSFLALGGAEIILNLGANNETVRSREKTEDAIRETSRRNLCAYAFASVGASESTSDMVFSGLLCAYERGNIVVKNKTVATEKDMLFMDIDLDKIRADRLKNITFKDLADETENTLLEVVIDTDEEENDGRFLKIAKSPFIPENEDEKEKRCKEIFDVQVAGLKKRLKITGGKAVVGISGGLDSTLALLVCAGVMDSLGLPRENIFAITMPAFGTSGRTYNNAKKLMEALGVTAKEIDIKDACLNHFEDIGHDKDKLDLTYENAQARERTQVLMDYAGKVGGIVVGTGDLSEMALGWCTYNGDHMSMYSVNCGIPKTLIFEIVKTLSKTKAFENAREILEDIVATPVSPELLPPDKKGEISQETESLVGPYILHDFFIYNVIRFGFAPSKVFEMAKIAFKDDFSEETILKWLKNFYKRFFSQQFKRNCVPDGIKIGSVGLSPRGDFMMPSDAAADIWLREANSL